MTGRSDASTVLLADDEVPLVEMYEVFLSERYNVVTATDGEEVLELVNESIDVVVLDRRMPRMAGDEALTALRERGYEMPVGIISAVEPNTDIIEMPLDIYLTKPVDSGELQKVVKLLMTRRDMDEQSQSFLRLASKKAALETADLISTDDPDIKELHGRIQTARAGMAKDLNGVVPSDSEQIPNSVDVHSVIN